VRQLLHGDTSCLHAPRGTRLSTFGYSLADDNSVVRPVAPWAINLKATLSLKEQHLEILNAISIPEDPSPCSKNLRRFCGIVLSCSP